MEIKSRLLRQLDRDIAAAFSPVQAACLRAKRATLLARHGALDEARTELTVLHQMAFQHPHPEIGAWLHLAEGLMTYFTDIGSSAYEKIQRAQTIARQIDLPEVESLAAGWLAHLAYVRHELPATLAHARECLDRAPADMAAARGRAHLVMGLAWHHAGREDRAQPWYQRARAYALQDGDDAAVSALMFNLAVMRISQLRRTALSSTARQAPELMLSIDSVQHYDDAVGAQGLAELTPLMRAQLMALRGEFAEAAALYEEHLPLAISRGLARLGSSLLSDLAWCRLQSGQTEMAAKLAAEAEIELDPSCELDDRAATHTRLAQIYQALGQTEAAQRHLALATRTWAEFSQEQAAWSRALEADSLVPDAMAARARA